MEERSTHQQQQAKRPSLTMDRAAFLLLRVKKAFKKKKQQRKEKNAAAAAAAAAEAFTGMAGAVGGAIRKPPPLLRSRTLPAIITPGATVKQTYQDPKKILDLLQSQQISQGLASTLKIRSQTPRMSFTYNEIDLNENRRRSASSRLGFSPSPRQSISSTGSDGTDGRKALRVPSPHSDGRSPRSSVSGTSSGRLARFLNQKQLPPPIVTYEDFDTGVRRLSWEKREKYPGCLRRSNSIDSMVEAVWSGPRRSEPAPISIPLPRPDRALSLISPSVGRRNKMQRGVAELPYGVLLEGCAGELPSLSTCAPHTLHHSNSAHHITSNKMTKKQTKESTQDRLSQVNIHLQALFAAVENGHLEKARNILESTDVDVNSHNADSLSPLDVALLANNRPLVRVLMENGAKEGTQVKVPETIGAHLRKLTLEAESRLHELMGCSGPGSKPCSSDLTCSRSAASTSAASAGTTGCAGGAGSERDKQIFYWEKRLKSLKRLTLGWHQTRAPDSPAKPEVEVCGSTTVAITLREKSQAGQDSPIFTKYKVQWSSRGDFSNICGSREVNASPGVTRVVASGLTRGRRYYFRAQAGNLKGWGEFEVSVPSSVVPSCWRDALPDPTPRFSSNLASTALDKLIVSANAARAAPLPRPRHRKTATIRQLFTAASKFQKHLRRGVYLACIFYCDEKVLVTNEEFLPVIEVDDGYPTCLFSDFNWLMRVASSWEDVKALRSEMEKLTSSSVHFRLKLLTAAAQMQSALCVQDLGQLHHKTLSDSQGTLVISCVRAVKTIKTVSALNSKWVPLSRLRKNLTALSTDNTISELLMASISEQIHFHQAAATLLPRGLYLSYVKLQSSVDRIRIVVTSKHPNVTPFAKIRDNPHVSTDEWEHLKSYKVRKDLPNASPLASMKSGINENAPSESQTIFFELVKSAVKRVFKLMDIPEIKCNEYRIYDLEVVDLTPDISFIVMCPPPEITCCLPGQKEILLQKDGLQSLPVLSFEMLHLETYQSVVFHKYSRISCFLELDVALAAHSTREAFSCSELQVAKEKLTQLEELQTNLNEIWKQMRWLSDVITFAREKEKLHKTSGIPVCNVLGIYPLEEGKENDEAQMNKDVKIDFLQIPPREDKIVKISPGRGSWPGPSTSGSSLLPEMSRSEQQLSSKPYGSSKNHFFESQCVSATSDSSNPSDEKSPIPHSARQHFLCIENVNVRLPPSKSQDAFFGVNLGMDPIKPPVQSSTASTPLLKVHPGSMISVKTATTIDSAQSLLSDSDTTSVSASSKTKLEPDFPVNFNLSASKSLTNVRFHPELKDSSNEILEANHFLGPALGLLEKAYQKPALAEMANEPEVISKKNKRMGEAGVLQVFAAYDTGLAVGTSLKLHVTQRTTAREVIDLVVKQLYMAAILKGKTNPLYGPEKLDDFCLVAVIGARERCLRDDFRPLQLQNPWRKGKLYVRLKHDVLAALHQSTKPYDYI